MVLHSQYIDKVLVIDRWPVARLIEREISRPLLLTRYLRKGRKTR
ncbi:MAG: hypothetical protein OXH51_04785 [Gemmatimonadetes bacterium]|nr:hypothetical protein [Gemmatimonadota bacterium]MCY3677745.1 hypothetical protein [Gemmatimonadota bacterium]